jgi:DNA polymerase-3 subunit alpha
MYCPLHAHDTFGSIGDSILKIKEYVKKASSLGMTSLALTNHGSMSTFVSFYEECKKNNINPIIGCEVYFADDRLIKEKDKKQSYHLVLLAKNYNGLKNIIKIHNDAHKNGFYYKPRTDLSVLRKYNQDVICLTGCLASPIKKALDGDSEYAGKVLAALNNIFKYDLYLEIQPGRFKEQIIYNDFLVRLSDITNINLVATNDIHYLNKEDAVIHDYHVKDARKMDNTAEMIYPDSIYYLMTQEELESSFVETQILTKERIKMSIFQSEMIANECNLVLPEEKFMPVYNKNVDEYIVLHDYCKEKLKTLKISDMETYSKRLDYELETIKTLGFSGYFLIVKDFLDFCDNNKIARGPGRGSGVASLVSYLLGISIADPIKYDLMFERFLSPFRHGVPDVDCDIVPSERERIYNHIKNRYGENHCCFVSTFNMRKARNAIKSACRILNVDIEISNLISKSIPYVNYEDDGTKQVDLSIQEAIDSVPEFRNLSTKYPEVINLAKKIEGYPSSMGIHPAGIVISPVPINDRYPLVNCKNDMLMATSLDLKDVEKLSGVKFDLLSLSSLSVIDKTMKEVGFKFDYTNEELLSDPKVWKLIGSNKTTGLFQISSSTYKTRMEKLHPKNIKELAACLALVRGPCISSGADKKYMNILNGEEKPRKLHDIYWEATKDTHGILIYQEQLLKICINAGFDPETAYDIMKAVAKKKIDKIKMYKMNFKELAYKKGVDEDTIEIIWKEIENAGLYAFNTAHAISYALLCYCSAYLKTYYPVAYMANLLTREYQKTLDSKAKQSINEVLKECKELNIKISPLSFDSKWDFTVKDNHIVMGFCSLMGFGEAAYNAFVNAKEEAKTLEEFIKKANGRVLNKKIILLLISSGVFGKKIKETADKYMTEIRGESWDGTIKLGTNKTMKIENSISYSKLFGSSLYKTIII